RPGSSSGSRSAGRRPPSTSHRRSARARAFARKSCGLDQLDLVAVRILDERDHRASALYRAGFAGDAAAGGAYALAGGGDVGHADRDMAVGRAQLVAVDAVVVGELEDRGIALVAIADEGERVALLRPLGAAQQLHAEDPR